MIAARIIEAKRDGERIGSDALTTFLRSYLDGDTPDYQMSAFLMAAYFNGLDPVETDVFVESMVGSGSTLDLDFLGGPRIDKHSTGGVGDKVSLVLAPLVASLGVFVPMMSGRGLGHTTGTLDKLEAIPGFRTDLSLSRFREVLQAVGCAMIGQTSEIAPLDKRVYALRDVTGTVPIPPLIAASIMSKKIAEGLSGLLVDVKVGSGAFIPEEDRAIDLATTMVGIGSRRKLPTVALLTAMDRPLGSAIGNGLETAEAIQCLRGEGPRDLRQLVVRQAGEMLRLAKVEDDRVVAERQAERALDAGQALERFVQLVEAQGGSGSIVDRPSSLATAALAHKVTAIVGGTVLEVGPKELGQGVVALGGGRIRMDESLDLGVGFEVRARPGDQVSKGDLLGVVHASDPGGQEMGEAVLRSAVRVGQAGDAPPHRPLVSHVVDRLGCRIDG